MIPFETTHAQREKLHIISVYFRKQGVNEPFITTAHKLAEIDQGVFELMELLYNNIQEQTELINAISKSIVDYKGYI